MDELLIINQDDRDMRHGGELKRERGGGRIGKKRENERKGDRERRNEVAKRELLTATTRLL